MNSKITNKPTIDEMDIDDVDEEPSLFTVQPTTNAIQQQGKQETSNPNPPKIAMDVLNATEMETSDDETASSPSTSSVSTSSSSTSSTSKSSIDSWDSSKGKSKKKENHDIPS